MPKKRRECARISIDDFQQFRRDAAGNIIAPIICKGERVELVLSAGTTIKGVCMALALMGGPKGNLLPFWKTRDHG